jgi:CO/xanthine dehydrogenase Mo-binding subunit
VGDPRPVGVPAAIETRDDTMIDRGTEWFAPTTRAEARALRAVRQDEATVIAGGTFLGSDEQRHSGTEGADRLAERRRVQICRGGWRPRHRRHATAEAIGLQEDRRGKGLCVLMKGMQTPSRASITIKHDGSHHIQCATGEMGQGVHLAIRTMAADMIGIDIDKVSIVYPDTYTSPVRYPHDLVEIDASNESRAERGAEGPPAERTRCDNR